MKNYEVTLLLGLSLSRDIDLDQPETKRVEFNVDAKQFGMVTNISLDVETLKFSTNF